MLKIRTKQVVFFFSSSKINKYYFIILTIILLFSLGGPFSVEISSNASYVRICLYLDISKDLANGIELSWDDEEWFQAIDYE